MRREREASGSKRAAMGSQVMRQPMAGRLATVTRQTLSLQRPLYELKNEIDNPRYRTVVDELKKQLHAKLAALL